ncbi:MAG: hypothetical protein AB7U83_01565 [Vicinamibacterales bacterium]
MRPLLTQLTIAAVLVAVAVHAQPVVLHKAPTDSAAVMTAAEFAKHLAEMDAKNIRTLRWLEGGEAFSVNVLHRTEAERPQVHGKIVDLYIVKSGSATLVTGGTLVEPRQWEGRDPGEMIGTAITGGVTRTVGAGDIVYIPPGVPHHFTGGDIVYFNVHFPVPTRSHQ